MFLGAIQDLLSSDCDEGVLIGVDCLRLLFEKNRELLTIKFKEFFSKLREIVLSDMQNAKKQSLDFIVTILSNWTGKEKETFSVLCVNLVSKIEEEETHIVLRLLDCIKILLSREDMKVQEKFYIK